ncbi:hypothetical protein GOP47_0027967 [Adiantum capillus-veneris]|nr:hypothetical protein GOP47_0027554 [Adiantum capillus-veneris]KAI5057952.1 hypothetical protein GOP47_0027967 [Adiantum capillus-veneris]
MAAVDPSAEGEDEAQLRKEGTGSWRHAAFHVATTIATPAAYAPLPFALASLGWPAGMGMLVMGTLVTWYSSILVASLWEWDGVPHTNYRELAQSIFGEKGYWAVTFFQQFASLGNNIAIQIAAGTSMKAIYKIYHQRDNMSLQKFMIIFGIVELGLSQFPTIHSLRWVNAVCTLSTIGFTTTSIGLSIYNGKKLDRSTIDYKIHGTKSSQVFGVFNALGTIAFSFGDAMLPEIQSTLKSPVKKNMYKGVSGAYVVIIATYWTLAGFGYWAFGSSVSPYLVNSFIEPSWAIILANAFAILQICGCYQIYCRPTIGYFEDTLVQRKKSDFNTKTKMLIRLLITTTYMAIVTLIACALPFFGDFVALCGAFGFTPLDFVIPAVAFLAVRKPKLKVVWIVNIVIAMLYTFVSILGSIGAIRFITIDIVTYKLFRDL